MRIKINGVEVREECIGETVEVKFENLTEEQQKKVFADNKEAFFINAVTSAFKTVRDFAIENIEDCSNNTVNKAIKILNNGGIDFKNEDTLLKILSSTNLNINSESKEVLASSIFWRVRCWVAKNPEISNKILMDLFIKTINDREVKLEEDIILLNILIKNPTFAFDKKMAEGLRFEA